MKLSGRRSAWAHRAAAWAALGLAGCGVSANDELPDELLSALREGRSTSQYPAGPYGKQVGDTAANICIEGWPNPRKSRFSADALETICLADFYAPDASSPRVLLLNTGAVWCTACQVEYAGTGTRPSLEQHLDERRERGLDALGVLFQNADRDPAQAADAIAWAEAFDVGFPFGMDAPFAVGAFADPLVQPTSIVIDARTMKVLLRIEGDEPATLWPFIDAALAE